jgi:hypothetical protein
MKAVFKLFWHICLMRQSPEYVPTYPWFVSLVIATNVIASIALAVTLGGTDAVLTAATSIIVSQSVTAVLVWLACTLREVPQRFTSAITAIFGCDLIVTAIFAVTLPITQLLNPALNAYTYLGFVLWSMWVVGFILKSVLNVHLALAIIIAFATVLLSTSVSQIAVGA